MLTCNWIKFMLPRMHGSQTNQIVIGLSKPKLLFMIIGSTGFVLLGYWIILIAINKPQYQNIIIWVVSISSILFFGMCGLYGLIKLFDQKAGLIIDRHGIHDNSSAVAVGLIKWQDIEGFETIKVKSTRFLLIHVRNPDVYVQQVNPAKRCWIKFNEQFYGTPLSLSSTSLNIRFDELISIILGEHEKYQPTNSKNISGLE